MSFSITNVVWRSIKKGKRVLTIFEYIKKSLNVFLTYSRIFILPFLFPYCLDSNTDEGDVLDRSNTLYFFAE